MPKGYGGGYVGLEVQGVDALAGVSLRTADEVEHVLARITAVLASVDESWGGGAKLREAAAWLRDQAAEARRRNERIQHRGPDTGSAGGLGLGVVQLASYGAVRGASGGRTRPGGTGGGQRRGRRRKRSSQTNRRRRLLLAVRMRRLRRLSGRWASSRNARGRAALVPARRRSGGRRVLRTRTARRQAVLGSRPTGHVTGRRVPRRLRRRGGGVSRTALARRDGLRTGRGAPARRVDRTRRRPAALPAIPRRPAPGPGPLRTAVGPRAGRAHLGGAELVLIGQRNLKLARGAAEALHRAERRLGRRIEIGSAYRSHAEQVATKRAKPRLAARPGTSRHEHGDAIDVSRVTPAVRRALLAEGWKQFDARKEPWHFSYRVVG